MNLIQVRYLNDNVVAVQDEKGHWKKDDSFYPYLFIYSENFDASKIPKGAKDYIRSISYAKRKVLWHEHHDKWLMLRKIKTSTPAIVPKLASVFERNGFIVFQADLPYLFNYLYENKYYIYKNVESMRTVIFDIETAMQTISGGRIKKKIEIPFLICAQFGDFSLKTFKFKKEIEKIYDGSPIDNVNDFFNDLKEERIVLNVGHNVTYDWTVLVDFGKRKGLNVPTMISKNVFQGTFHGSSYNIPKFMTTFDTLLGVGVSMPRPSSYGLKALVSALKLRDRNSRVYLDTKRIFEKFKVDRNEVIQYCRDDVEDTRLLFDYISASCFIPAIEAGLSVENFLFSGVKTIWEAMMARECVNEQIVIPQYDTVALQREKSFCNPFLKKYKELGKVKGGLISDIDRKYKNKVLKDVFNVDITSAFPTITLQYNLSPETVIKCSKKEADVILEFENEKIPVKLLNFREGILTKVLEQINRIVIELKQKKKKDPSLVRVYKGFKAIRDSHYAVPGIRTGRSRFKNRLAMGVVHHYCREILSTIEQELKVIGYDLIFTDTDGVLVHLGAPTNDPKTRIELDVANITHKINAKFQKNIEIDVEGYESLFVLNPKNYIYREFGNREIHYKGILNSRTIPFVITKCLDVFFNHIFDTQNLENLTLKSDVFREMRKIVMQTEEPRDFAINLFLKERSQYKNKVLKKLSERFGSGSHLVYVRKTADLTAKPYSSYEDIYEFEPEILDRKWYWWYLTRYLIADVCKVPIIQKVLSFATR